MKIPVVVIIACATVALTGVGCKYVPDLWPGKAKSASSSSATNAPFNPNLCQLGELNLTNHFETVVALGKGRQCVLVPRSKGAQNIEVMLTLESRAEGKTKELSVRKISAKPGQLMEVAFGETKISFTPKLIPQ
jgi:hypothetical protein